MYHVLVNMASSGRLLFINDCRLFFCFFCSSNFLPCVFLFFFTIQILLCVSLHSFSLVCFSRTVMSLSPHTPPPPSPTATSHTPHAIPNASVPPFCLLEQNAAWFKPSVLSATLQHPFFFFMLLIAKCLANERHIQVVFQANRLLKTTGQTPLTRFEALLLAGGHL